MSSIIRIVNRRNWANRNGAVEKAAKHFTAADYMTAIDGVSFKGNDDAGRYASKYQHETGQKVVTRKNKTDGRYYLCRNDVERNGVMRNGARRKSVNRNNTSLKQNDIVARKDRDFNEGNLHRLAYINQWDNKVWVNDSKYGNLMFLGFVDDIEKIASNRNGAMRNSQTIHNIKGIAQKLYVEHLTNSYEENCGVSDEHGTFRFYGTYKECMEFVQNYRDKHRHR